MNNRACRCLSMKPAWDLIVFQCRTGCGDLPQFDTPELNTFSSIQSTKWETSESIDPYSYGYNRATTVDLYKSATTILHRLIGERIAQGAPHSTEQIIDAEMEQTSSPRMGTTS